MAKLSKTQEGLLKDLNKDDVKIIYMRGWGRENSYWFVSETYKHYQLRTVHALRENGYITHKRVGMIDAEAVISDKGKEYLKNLKEE